MSTGWPMVCGWALWPGQCGVFPTSASAAPPLRGNESGLVHPNLPLDLT